MPPQVSVIVLTHNGKKDTLECLSSLAAVEDKDWNIILVDNGSSDGTLDVVRCAFPDVKVIENRANLGFAEGNNVGVRYAVERGSEYILLLNNDTHVEPTFQRELLRVAESDPSIGIVGPRIFSHDRPESVWFDGGYVDWNGGSITRVRSGSADNSAHEAFPVDCVEGTALCIKRQVIDSIGLLDPRFFFYYEETDWCVRAHRVGYKIMLAPNARIWHKVSGTIGRGSPATTYYMTRNVFLFFGKHLMGLERAQVMGKLLLREIRTLLAYSTKPRYKTLHLDRNIRVHALRDVLLGRWGPMGSDVAALCVQRKSS